MNKSQIAALADAGVIDYALATKAPSGHGYLLHVYQEKPDGKYFVYELTNKKTRDDIEPRSFRNLDVLAQTVFEMGIKRLWVLPSTFDEFRK